MARVKKADDSSSPKKSTSRAKSNGGAAAPAQARIPSTIATVTTMTMTDEQVRARAYELYLERRGDGGTAEEDWYRAEAELRGKSA
jgi:cytoskeletal protein RodZ